VWTLQQGAEQVWNGGRASSSWSTIFEAKIRSKFETRLTDVTEAEVRDEAKRASLDGQTSIGLALRATWRAIMHPLMALKGII
jgi:hypothetical protein